MRKNLKILIIVFNDFSYEFVSELALLLDVIYGENRVSMENGSTGHFKEVVDKGSFLLFCISEFNDQIDEILQTFSVRNPCFVIYDENRMIDVRRIIQSNVKGVLSLNSLAELPGAMADFGNLSNFICQRSLKSLIGTLTSLNISKSLSEREIQVLSLLSEGDTYQEIGAKLHISYDTIKTHTYNIYRKLGAKNKTEAVQKARISMMIS